MKLFPAVASLILGALAQAALAPPANAADAIGDCISASTDGQTLRKEGKLLAAHDRFIACERVSCPAVVRSHCASWRAEVDPLIPSVVIRAQDAHGLDLIDARLTIDSNLGKLDGNVIQLDPGTHTIVVEPHDASGARTQKVLLASGEHARLVVVRFEQPRDLGGVPKGARPPSAEPAADHHVPVGAWVLGGIGIAALGSAAYLIVAATSDRNSLAHSCAPYCSSSATQPGRTDALAADILFAAGGTALGAALIWAFAFPETSAADTATRTPRLDLRPVAGGAVGGVTLRW